MDPFASLLYADQTNYGGGSSSTSPHGSRSSASPPGSATSLDFSMTSISPPNEFTSSWEATMQQLARTDAGGEAPYLAGNALWGGMAMNAGVKSLPFSFGGPAADQQAIIPGLPTPISPHSYPDFNGFGYEAAGGDVFTGAGSQAGLFDFNMPLSVDPASLINPAITLSPPHVGHPAQAQTYAMPGGDRRASLGSVNVAATRQPVADNDAKRRRVSVPATAVPSVPPMPSELGTRFKARIPPEQAANYARANAQQGVVPPTLPSISFNNEPATGEKRKAPPKEEEDTHNAVERRYRTKINSYIVGLQTCVPALAHLVDPPDIEPTHRRKSSAFVLSSTPSIPAGTMIDGVAAAGKLSKGIVLGKSLDYIRHLKRERERLQIEREITRSILGEFVDQSEYLLAEVDRRFQSLQAELEARYAAEYAEEEAKEAAMTTRAPRRQLNKAPAGPKSKKAKKAETESEESEGEEEPAGLSNAHLSVNDASLRARGGNGVRRTVAQQQRFPLSPETSQDGITPPGPPRAMLATFAGISFMGGLGYDLANASKEAGQSPAASAVAWTPRELVKRAFVVEDGSRAGLAGVTAAPGSGVLFLGIASVVGWLIYLAWPLLGAMVGHHRALSARRRASAHAALGSVPKPGEGELARARRAREALTTLARMPTNSIGAFFGLTWEAALGAVGVKTRSFSGASTEDEKAEVALALIRLAEIYTAYSDGVCCLTQRLYAFVRLHNLVHSPAWPIDGHPALALARVNATLALQLVSIFGSQSSPLSRRRRLWKAALTEPKKTEGSVEPWVLAALGANYDEAMAIQRAGPICGKLSSPSDSLPLLRVAEARCEKALLDIWSSLFTSVVSTTCLTADLPSAPVDLRSRIDHILEATLPGSPLHTLARLTLGIFVLGSGDISSARNISLMLALEAREGGPAAGLASVAAFGRLLLGDAVALFLHTGRPAGRLDALATAGVRWLLVRQRVAASGSSKKVDRDLYEAARSLRSLLAHEVFKREGLEEAQLACVEALEVIGRRAAGLRDEDSDSGFDEE